MALSSDDLPELPKPANATLGLVAKRLRTWATISSMPSRGTGLRISHQSASGATFWPALHVGVKPCAEGATQPTRSARPHALRQRQRPSAAEAAKSGHESRGACAQQAATSVGEQVVEICRSARHEELMEFV